MNRNSAEDPADSSLTEWIEDRQGRDTNAAKPGRAADLELLELLSDAQRATADEMTEAEAQSTLAAVQRRVAEASTSSLRTRHAVMAVAAVLGGLAIGLAALAPPRLGHERGGPTAEIIKKVSFESTHEGKVVRFQLELSRVR